MRERRGENARNRYEFELLVYKFTAEQTITHYFSLSLYFYFYFRLFSIPIHSSFLLSLAFCLYLSIYRAARSLYLYGSARARDCLCVWAVDICICRNAPYSIHTQKNTISFFFHSKNTLRLPLRHVVCFFFFGCMFVCAFFFALEVCWFLYHSRFSCAVCMNIWGSFFIGHFCLCAARNPRFIMLAVKRRRFSLHSFFLPFCFILPLSLSLALCCVGHSSVSQTIFHIQQLITKLTTRLGLALSQLRCDYLFREKKKEFCVWRNNKENMKLSEFGIEWSWIGAANKSRRVIYFILWRLIFAF